MARMIYRSFRKTLPRFHRHRFSSLVEKLSGTEPRQSYRCMTPLGSSTPFRHRTLLSMPYHRPIGQAGVSWLWFRYLPLTVMTRTKFLRWIKHTSRFVPRIHTMHNRLPLVNTHRYNNHRRSTSRTIIHRNHKLRITRPEKKLRTRVPPPHRIFRRIIFLHLDITTLRFLSFTLLGIVRRKPLRSPPISRT